MLIQHVICAANVKHVPSEKKKLVSNHEPSVTGSDEEIKDNFICKLNQVVQLNTDTSLLIWSFDTVDLAQLTKSWMMVDLKNI